MRKRTIVARCSLLGLGASSAFLVVAGPVAAVPVGATTDPTRVQIATTVAPITSIVANIVGDRADVTGIVPEGTNSHTFEPQPSVAELLSTADVVYINGLAARGADQGAGRGEPARTAPRSSSSAR